MQKIKINGEEWKIYKGHKWHKGKNKYKYDCLFCEFGEEEGFKIMKEKGFFKEV
jgi:hypothetical protein